MQWVFALLLLLAGSTMLPPATAQQRPEPEKRIALVIGIGHYQNAPALINPPNDAQRMAEALRRLNFTVDEAIDADFASLTRKLREFDLKAQQADAALIFYAGHGVQVDRENYLVPADAKLSRERDLYYEAIQLDLVLGAVSQAKKVGIVLLDACRNNPFVDKLSRSLTIAGRGGNRATQAGLARVDNVPRNTVVVMSTRANEIAEDGGGDDSPFTQAVLAHLRIPGLELSLFFRSVRDTVLKATNNRQEPYVFSSLGAEPFYFNPRPPNRPPLLGTIKPLEVSDAGGPTPIGVPRPTDPDDDPLTIHIVGLPRSGEIRIAGKSVAINDTVSLESFMQATYKPDGKVTGTVGTFDYMVDDGRGGTTMGILPLSVVSSNHPPVVESERTVRVYPGFLRIGMPTDPDGDPVTVTITGLPGRGVVRAGTTQVKIGDKIRPEQLGSLSYWSEPGATGDVGAVTYNVDDGRGGKTDGKVTVQIAGIDEHTGTEADIWQRISDRGGVEDIDSFLRLYPDSSFAEQARKRRVEIAAATPAAKPTQPPASIPAVTPAPAMPLASAMPPRETKVAGLAVPSRGSGQPTFQDCPLCPVMVNIPAGTFMMGQASDPGSQPVRRVSVQAMALGQHPVTVAEWRACMAENGCRFMPRMANPSDQTPVHNLSWDDAQQYIAWLAGKTGRKYRLPSEAEWEYAARAGTTTPYWWGQEVGVFLANCTDCSGNQDRTTPLPVGSFKANPFGLYDMNGGVSQMMADCWFKNYLDAPATSAPREQKGCQAHVLRGGSFRTAHDNITAYARSYYDASVRYIANGFRVAADTAK